MRNLFKKDIACSGIDARFMILVVTLLMIISFVPSLRDFFIIASYLLLIGAPLILFLNIFNYSETDYYIVEVFYPIKIYKIILSRYISYLIITMLSISIIALIILVRYKILGIVLEDFQVNILGLGVVIAILYGALVLLGSFIFGNRNIKVIGMISFALVLIPIRIFMEVVSYVINLNNVYDIYNHRLLIQILMAFSVVLYVISALISICGFNKRIKR